MKTFARVHRSTVPQEIRKERFAGRDDRYETLSCIPRWEAVAAGVVLIALHLNYLNMHGF